jgi:Domain of unknown function (DUF4166)/Saccharopine dehydrogenase NADP binding domain
MKILILGGYGVFGGRLCELLAPITHLRLCIAGRSLEKARAFCRLLPPGAKCEPIAFDRDHRPGAQIQHIRPDLLIDASGPFQFYGENPYRVVEACLANDVNYMDFADGSDFVKGVSQFDQQARDRGLYALSGVSSFPVLTAAVVRKLTQDAHQVASISGGIAPSPYAGVGMNVIRAISAYAGKPVRVVRGGHHTFAFALTEARRYTICPPGHLPLKNLRFSLVDVPDLHVLPQRWPEVKSVWMGAGPVPASLHRMLNGLAWLVRLRLLSTLAPFAPLFFHAINILRWGEHRGGMFVEVELLNAQGIKTTRSWHLLAEGADGPYIPCMALDAIIRRTLRGQRPPAGARPATMELELDDYERLFAPRKIYTGERILEQPSADSIFRKLLGSAWRRLPAPIQSMHEISIHENGEHHASGVASVERGKTWLAHLIATIFGLPVSGRDIPVNVSMKQSANGEIWKRTFAGRTFSSFLSLGAGRSDKLLCERFGPVEFELALVLDEGKLRFIVRGWKLWQITLPLAWAPSGDSYEHARDGKFFFNIEIRHPLTGLIVSYSGWLARNTARVD